MTTPTDMTAEFASRLLGWFDSHGRKDLPWQQGITPYRVWLSEIMLQQTQVTTVIPYFQRFTAHYPSVEALARAEVDDVLHLWTGLGYYARARNLHKAARQVLSDFGGQFPASVEALCTLPGIGRSTAGAIVSIAFGKRAAILDGNVKRVLARHQAIGGWPGTPAVHNALWSIAESFTPQQRHGDYTQAIMDLGATLCTRGKPRCQDCPVSADCLARIGNQQREFPGSKPRTALPVRSRIWLILLNQAGEVLLEKRPDSGLWGGLWTFPETESRSELPSFCHHLSIATKPATALPARRHTFSHFHLDYQPVLHQVTAATGVADSPAYQWVNPDQLSGRGTPAPVKQLLQELAAGHHSLASNLQAG